MNLHQWKTSTGGTLLCIVNHLSYKCSNALNICKTNKLESIFNEIVNPKQSNVILGVIFRHYLWILPSFIGIT